MSATIIDMTATGSTREPVVYVEQPYAIYYSPACPACGSRRTKRLAQGYPLRMCQDCGRSSLYGALVPEKGE